MNDEEKVFIAPADLYDVMCRNLKEQHALPAASGKSTDKIIQLALVTGGNRWIANRVENENTTNPWIFTSPIRWEANTAGGNRQRTFSDAPKAPGTLT